MAAGSISYRGRAANGATFGVEGNRPQDLTVQWMQKRLRIRVATDTGKELSVLFTPAEAMAIFDTLKSNEIAIAQAEREA